MGIVSINNTGRLLWLGRYTERVYTTIRVFNQYFDRIIDSGDDVIGDFCTRLGIPNLYPDGETFVEHYCFDEDDPNSIAANLLRAYDNAVTLREEIGSEAVSYIQLAVYDLQATHGDRAPLLGMQKVLDHILAFWGIADDLIPEENVRNIMKVGKRIERMDLYCRLQAPRRDIQREALRLADRLRKTDLRYDPSRASALLELAKHPPEDLAGMVALVDSLLEE